MQTVDDETKRPLLLHGDAMLSELKSQAAHSLPSPATWTGVPDEKRKMSWRMAIRRILAFFLLCWTLSTALDLLPGFLGYGTSVDVPVHPKAQADLCPQTEPLNPKAHADLESRLALVFQDSSYKRKAYDALSGAIQVPCVSTAHRCWKAAI